MFGKMPQWNVYLNCHVNGITFQGGLRFQTGLSSLQVSYKCAPRCKDPGDPLIMVFPEVSNSTYITAVMAGNDTF